MPTITIMEYPMQTSKLNLIINETGNEYFENRKKDSWQSLFIVLPISLIVIGGCFFLTAGLTWRFVLVMIWPLIMIGLAFFYTPLISRGKSMTHTLKRIIVDGGNVSFETYDWFTYQSVSISTQLSEVKVKVWSYQMSYKGKKVFLVILNNSEENTFYFVEEFFDNSDDFLKLFDNNNS